MPEFNVGLDVTANLDNYENKSTKAAAEGYLKKELGVRNVNLKGLSKKAVNKINESLYNIYVDSPELKGVIQKIETSNQSVASFVLGYRYGKITAKLTINPNDIARIDDIIEANISSGAWTQKNGMEGVLRHEMAHALEAKKAFKDMDMFSSNPNEALDRYKATMSHMHSNYANQTVKKAFYELGIEVTEKNLETHVSKYASRHFASTGKLNEAFAEILSDNSKGKLYKILFKIVGGK